MSENSESSRARTGQVGWNELVTTNVAAAQTFYTGLLGWTAEPFGAGGEYTMFKKGDTMVAGMMKIQQPGVPAHWLAYVVVDDVDATAGKAGKLGGRIVAPPFNVPDVGRISVVLDPQGAPIGLFKPAA